MLVAHAVQSRSFPQLVALEVVGKLGIGEPRGAAGAAILTGLAGGGGYGARTAATLLLSLYLDISYMSRNVRVGVIECLHLLAVGDKERTVLLRDFSGSVLVSGAMGILLGVFVTLPKLVGLLRLVSTKFLKWA